MKTGIRFALTFSGLSLAGLIVVCFFDKELSGEIASYMFWFYVFNGILSLLLFPVIIMLVGRTGLNNFYRWGIYFLVALLPLNLICYFFDEGGKIATIELLKPIVGKSDSLWFNSMVHLIAVFSFFIAMVVFKRKLRGQVTVFGE